MSSTQISTRERILAETWRLMEQRRGEGVRLEDVAKAAGVSRQAVYLHFASRAELLKATLDYVEQVFGLSERLQPVFQQQGVPSLEALIAVWSSFIPEVYGISTAFLAARHADPDASAAWNERMQKLYDGCLLTAQCVARDDRLADGWTIHEAADYLWSMLSFEQWEHLVINRGWTQAQYLSRLSQVIMRTMLKAP
jgi:AcrR family transcriptional regulator